MISIKLIFFKFSTYCYQSNLCTFGGKSYCHKTYNKKQQSPVWGGVEVNSKHLLLYGKGKGKAISRITPSLGERVKHLGGWQAHQLRQTRLVEEQDFQHRGSKKARVLIWAQWTAHVKMLGRQFDMQPRGQGTGHGGSHWHVDVKYFIFYLNDSNLGGAKRPVMKPFNVQK